MNPLKIIELEEGWEFMVKGITKLKRILEEEPELHFSSEEYMMLYTYPFVFYLALVLTISPLILYGGIE